MSSDKPAYVDLSREAIGAFDAAFNTPGQQENAGSSSGTGTGLDGYRRQPADGAFDAAFNTPGQQENAGSSSGTGTGLDGYRRQPADADGAPVYGRYQARGPRR